MQNGKHDVTIQVLEHIRKHPGMYFSEMAPAVVNFLEGFKIALAPEVFDVVYADALRLRGWDVSSKAVWQQMREKNYDEEAINAEMLAIYLDVWREIERREAIQAPKNMESTDQ